jgi:hypothetical protein
VARYADTLLSDGEEIVLRTRQHWLATVIDGRGPWALLILALIGLVARAGMSGNGPLEQGLLIVGLVALAIALLMLVRVYWAWWAQDYIVTNRRVLKVEGIFNKRSADSSLEKINDAVLEQNLVARILGYGDLEILTAAETSVDLYRMLKAAPTFKKVMLDKKYLLESEAGRGPGAPLGGPGAGDRPMSADEVTKALGDLATLRDRGAITAEEFEAKKADLLGRL